MGEQVSAAAIEAAALRMCRRPRWPASWDEDARDYWRYLAQDALTAALPYLAAHQPARVVPSAEEVRAEAERQYPRRGPAVGFTWDDDMRAAFVYGAAWATRTETKGGE